MKRGETRPQRTAHIAWGLLAACVPLYLVTVCFTALYRSPAADLALVTAFLVTPAVGALVASRQPQNAVGWLLLVTGFGFGILGAASEYAALSERESIPAGPYFGVLANAGFIVILLSGGILVPLLFPNGRLLSPRWRWVVYASAVAMVLGVAGSIVKPGPLDLPHTEASNPFGIAGTAWVLSLAVVFLALTGIAAGLSLLIRFKRSRGDERQQLKWFVFAVALMALAVIVGFFGSIYVVELAFYTLLFFGLPASIGAAILRYRLYDIDRIINRTLTYGLLTAALGAVYLGLVVGLQALLRPVNGGSDLALAVTTLLVAALFLPARRAVQRAVDRRFNRRAYDAARTIDAFGARLREQVDLDTLHYELLAVVDETMQPSRASLWLRDPVEARR